MSTPALISSGQGLISRSDPHPSWTVNTAKPVSYHVRLAPGLLDPANPVLAEAGSTSGAAARRLVVVEERVHALYGARLGAYFASRGVRHEFLVLDADERAKTMESVFGVVEAMDGFGIARRHEPVVAVGGGVLTDIVGLAASLYRRSTPYVRVPTTLIGLIDAGIGAKTGVNHGAGKNRLGSYHPSSSTLLEPEFLRTLDERHVSNGLAEILKIALIKDARLFALLEEHAKRLVSGRLQGEGGVHERAVDQEILGRAVQGMLEELQPNLWEHQLKRLVDYGHSLSPTIEMAALPELLHGEAVCVDMALTTVVAARRGTVSDEQCRRVLDLMHELRLPVWHPVCTRQVLEAALADTVRHRDGHQNLPLPVGIGRACFVDDLDPREVLEAASVLRQRQQAVGESR